MPLVECLLSVLYSSIQTATPWRACAGGEVASAQKFELQSRVERLADRIVQRGAGASHGLGDAGGSARLDEEIAGVLTTLVGVKPDPA
jgi:hypothetical protein